MENIILGQSIKIKRTDGRIHDAVVKYINDEKYITVQWYECGVIKGKEVELDEILELNPDIIQNSNDAPSF